MAYDAAAPIDGFEDGLFLRLPGAQPETITITGTVTIDERAIGDAIVTVTDALTVRRATTGSDGAFTFGGLPAGEYTVAATAPGLFCDEWSVGVRAGERASTDITCVVPPRFSGPVGINIGNTDGSNARRLTAGNRPAWSPDGLKIVFDRQGEIHVINADGSNEIALTRGVEPAWSPDGTRIVFADDEGISAMNADGSGVTGLIRYDFIDGLVDAWRIGKPAWSPDGERIAFEHFGDGGVTPARSTS